MALIVASRIGSMDAVDILLANKANVNLLTFKRSPLLEAIGKGHKEIVIKLLDNRANPNSVVSYVAVEDTPLYHAAKLGRHDLIDLLLENGAVKDLEGHDSAIQGAVRGGKLKTVEYLLNKGFDINAKDGFGNTPLFGVRSLEMTQYLLDNGANPKIRNKNNHTADKFLYGSTCPPAAISLIEQSQRVASTNHHGAKSRVLNNKSRKGKAT